MSYEPTPEVTRILNELDHPIIEPCRRHSRPAGKALRRAESGLIFGNDRRPSSLVRRLTDPPPQECQETPSGAPLHREVAGSRLRCAVVLVGSNGALGYAHLMDLISPIGKARPASMLKHVSKRGVG